MSGKRLHHHGNLRPALVDAGIQILESEGLKALSLRKVAASAGVSHAAPAHHFSGKDGLLAAIAAKAFETFTRTMREHRSLADPDPRSQLVGLCEGYLAFAKEHRAQFQLIFSTPVKENPTEELRKTSAEAFNILLETCEPFEYAESDPLANAIMIWSLVHGYATLQSYNKMMRGDTKSTPSFKDILPKLPIKLS